MFSGSVGCGKSVVAASFPTPDNKTRRVFDFEDSMAYIDAGENGADVYTPRKQRFRMKRYIYPSMQDMLDTFLEIRGGESDISVVIFDNVAIFQENLVGWLQNNAQNVELVRTVFGKFAAKSALPHEGVIKKWAYQKDPSFWSAAKAIPKAFIMESMKQGVHLIATSEEANVWKDYGTNNAKVEGKKAKIWDVWMKHFDMVIFLKRDINTTKPPTGSINPLQPKLRLQGFNPSWSMDWAGFITELKASLEREEPEIPEEAKVDVKQFQVEAVE